MSEKIQHCLSRKAFPQCGRGMGCRASLDAEKWLAARE